MNRPSKLAFAQFGLVALSYLTGVESSVLWQPVTSHTVLTKVPEPPPSFSSTEKISPADMGNTEQTESSRSASKAASLWARAAGEGDWRRRGQRFENLGASLTKMDRHEALRIIDNTKNRIDRNALVRGFFGQLAEGGSSTDAIDLALQISDRDERGTALMTLVDCWTDSSADSLRHRAWLIDSHGLEAGLGMELLASNPPNLELATAWAGQLKDEPGRADLLTGIATKLVSSDPNSALLMGRDLTGDHYVTFLQNVLEQWAQSNPQAALNWSAQISDPVIQLSVQKSIGSGWALMDDEESAMNYLAEMPAGAARTEFIEEMTQSQLALHSAADAGAWAEQLTDPSDRQTAQALIDSAPPPVTGVGARVDGEDGMVVVSSLVSGSPAEGSGQLKPGDRIVAVAQAGEDFVTASSVDLDTLVGMIRGNAGSSVQLQVASPQAGGYGPPHIVQLTRTALGHGE